MNLFWRYGRKIRPGNRHLLFRRATAVFLPLFVLTCLCFYALSPRKFDVRHISVESLKGIFTPYFFFTIAVAMTVCVAAAILLFRYQSEYIKQLIHRQKLARMVLDNGWYTAETRKAGSFFKDVQSSGNGKEVIRWFPKIYYQMKDGKLRIRVEVNMGKYQEQLLHLEKKFETGLFAELTDRILCDGFVEYVLLYDMVGNRITIEDIVAENGALKLMKTMWWQYDGLPHMLIVGGTGSGKSYYILCLIEALMRIKAVICVLDPKNADLADLSTVIPDVYHKKEDMIACLKKFYEDMLKRSEDMKLLPGYQTGKNYAALGLEPHFLIFDEYVAFMNMLKRERDEVLEYLSQIVMLGRQSGYFLILACQRPDAKYLGDGIRDQFNFRVALGRNSELGYNMMFGETNKDFFLKQIKGRGYVDAGTGVISEFYTPLVPKGHDFLKTIGELYSERNRVEEKEDEKGGKDNVTDHGV